MEERRRQKAIDDEVERKYANATLAESEAHRKVYNNCCSTSQSYPTTTVLILVL
jgi:hypothetical protein